MFLTSIPVWNGDLFGLYGADLNCQAIAEDAGLAGTFRAWLSDSTHGPSTTFTQGTVPYTRADGTPENSLGDPTQDSCNDWFSSSAADAAHEGDADSPGLDRPALTKRMR